MADATHIDITLTDDATRAPRVRVWDRFVRLFHWSLAASVAIALATGFVGGPRLLVAHLVAGVLAAALVVARLAWGFLGPRHARFADFVVGPGATIAHLRAALAGRPSHHLGHNPLGGAMVVALMLAVAALSLTGAVALGGALKEGPLAATITFATGRAAREAHEWIAFALIGLISLHLAGVVLESLRTSENLAAAMITGDKRARGATAPAIAARPTLAVLVVVAICAVATQLTLAGMRRPALGVPTAPLDASYARECGACHAAPSPAIASSKTWRRVMAGLDDHYGDNASLDADTARALSQYLDANAAERWDTQVSRRVGAASVGEDLRVTRTRAWTRLHEDIAPATFAAKPVGGAINCAACHRDAATGRFSVFAIDIPHERTAP
ncbi:MAG: cytochrome b/b6 domain-containing protein [Rhizobiales bacterium]|nr:cytochrome b/b6 domain-containing protein [Hyphomicrobiales bacterium]